MNFYSQLKQDKYLYDNFFNSKKNNGFFLEIGADDGIRFSNSYFFEKHLNWDGICIEASPTRYKELVNNRNSINVNALVYSEITELEFLNIEGYGRGLSGIVEKYGKHEIRVEQSTKSDKTISKDVIKLKTCTVDSILLQHNITHIDYLSLDVEGSELNVLQGIDFSRTNIDFMTVENNYNDANLKRYIEEQGYQHIKRLGVDDVYKKIT